MKTQDLGYEEVRRLFTNTNFGGVELTDSGRRGLMVECVLKRAAGYRDGGTIERICVKAGLLCPGHRRPRKAGLRWAFDQMYRSGGPTIVERLVTWAKPL